MNVGRREDQLLDNLGALYSQRREVRSYVTLLVDGGLITAEVGLDLLNMLADREKK